MRTGRGEGLGSEGTKGNQERPVQGRQVQGLRGGDLQEVTRSAQQHYLRYLVARPRIVWRPKSTFKNTFLLIS